MVIILCAVFVVHLVGRVEVDRMRVTNSSECDEVKILFRMERVVDVAKEEGTRCESCERRNERHV